MNKGKIAVLVGPTACGKTDVSIRAAKALNAEIVSADSVQVYERLDIGSAKPSVQEMQGVVHHMISAVSLDTRDFSVAQYQKMAFRCIDDILSRSKLPLIVGGTGLYIHALTYPMDFTQAIADPLFREKRARMEHDSAGVNYLELQRIDPITAQRLHPNDQTRIVRALEIFYKTQKTLSDYSSDFKNQDPPYESAIFGLTIDREKLYERIDRRVDHMMTAGLLQEVRAILADGYDASAASLRGLGYKELISHLAGNHTLEEAVEIIKRDTRRFAKRQWTWFRRDPRITWFNVDEYEDVNMLANELIAGITANLLK